jgi:hypothetical protein
MLKHKLLSSEGILILEPVVPLETSDFSDLVREIDPYIAEHGKLPGLMLHAKGFPGWLNFEAALAHKQFIWTHHQKIQRLAVVSDNWLLMVLSKIVAHLVHPAVKHFSESSYEEALQWLRSNAQ